MPDALNLNVKFFNVKRMFNLHHNAVNVKLDLGFYRVEPYLWIVLLLGQQEEEVNVFMSTNTD